MARAGGWDVTVAAPARFRGDFGWHTTEPRPDEPCDVVPIATRFGGRVHTMLYGQPLRDLLAQRWDAVHCWEEPYVAATAQIARAVSPRTPLVVATFQNILKRYPPPFNWIERVVRRRADGVIAFGRTTRDVLDARGWTQPARTIPPGVDVTSFAPDAAARDDIRRKLRWDDRTPVVGFVGRFVAGKGLGLLTAALGRVKAPWRALFVGAGPLERDLRSWAAEYGDRVHVETAVAHDRVPAFLNAMDLLAAPSQTTPGWREQFGRMLVEAFACAVPVLASDSGEIPYVVDDAGVIVGERDREGWIAAIDRLLADAGWRAELGRRGRARAESVFAWPVVARTHLAFLNERLG
jgi:glycosyltransferase involved in cell wall biosynthesis